MPHLEIRTSDGRTESRRLSRRNPIVIGRNPISDVHVDDESVAPIHCRVSWNGKAFEVAAVGGDGVDVNGVLVRRKELTTGDLIRVGELDLVVTSSRDANAAGAVKREARKAEERRPKPPLPETAPAELADDEWAALSASEVEVLEEPAKKPAAPPRSRREEPQRLPKETTPARPAEQQVLDEEAPVLLDEPTKPAEPVVGPMETAPAKGLGRLRQTRRPGEQDILTSPLVLGFGGLALVLLLAAGTFWLLIGREGADRLYEAAVADREAGRHAQAIRSYEQFLLEYPADDRAAEARYALGQTRIERYAGGSAPDFPKALEEIDAFVRANRDAGDFETQREPLREFGRRIASGASAAAVRTGDRQHLEPAQEGRRLFDRYAGSEGSLEEIRQKLSADFRAAEAAVRKREYFDDAAAKIDAAIAKKDFPTAFGVRSDLLTRYPDLGNDRRVRALLERTLEAEKQLVRTVDPPQGQTSGPADASAAKALTLVGHTQARAGEVSDGRLVFAVARDALIGLDAVTGRPRWRTSVGLDTPFFPIEVDASVPALLAFDAGQNELILVAREDGATQWRAKVGAAATGPPFVAQGQVDLATADGRSIRFALDSGEPLASVAFPQPVVGPPVLTGDGERLVLFGEQATAYTLDLRSLAVVAVSFTGHAAGALDAPPQALGRLVVTCENDRLDSSIVRAFSLDPESGTLRSVAAERVEGRIREPAMARGNVLFVPSAPERITAFSVSDDAGQPPLARLAGIQIPEGSDVPTFLVPGPDGMLWAAGSALRKLKLVADGLELLPGRLAPGRHTQPPQTSGESLFVARSLPSAAAVYVSQADREAMTGSWRTVLGASIVLLAASDKSVAAVTEAGQFASASLADVSEGGFLDVRPLPQWDEGSAEPLRGAAFGSGAGAAWRGGGEPLLWFVPAGGQPTAPRRVTGAPECAPAALEGGIVLPLPGRLEWLPLAGGPQNVEAFLLPVTGEGQAARQWKFVATLDGNRVAAIDDEGTLRVVGRRDEPLPHLAELAITKLSDLPERPPVAVAGKVAVGVGKRVELLDPAGLRPVAEAELESVLTGGPWAAGELAFVQLHPATLVALDGSTLERRWQVALDGPAAGEPVRTATGWLAASQTGTVLQFNAMGAEIGKTELAVPLTGLHKVGDQVVATSLDGSLYQIALDDRSDAAESQETAPPPESSDPAAGAQEAVR